MNTILGKGTATSELQQVVAYILDIAAMAETITALIEKEMVGFAKEMSAIDSCFPGFGRRLRRQVSKEIKRAISQRIPVLRREFEAFLHSRLTLGDIKTALAFQRERVLAELRDTAFIKSLETEDRDDASLSANMSARMSPEQHAVVACFLASPCGVKLAPLTPEMETLKYGWMQAIADSVSQRLPMFGKEILQKHYAGRPNPSSARQNPI